MSEKRMVMVGAIMGAHGVHGQVKIKAFTEDPSAFANLSPVHLGADGEAVALKSARVHKLDVLIATLDGVTDRDTAQAMKSVQLFIPRDRLDQINGHSSADAEAQEDFYLSDLEGLAVKDAEGRLIGVVSAVLNYGASDVLEIALDGSSAKVMVPFIEDAVPQVDLEARHVVIDPAYMA